MRFASSLSDEPELELAVSDCSARLRDGLDGAHPDLLFAFVAGHIEGRDRLPELVSELVGEVALVGCSATGVVGDGREIEEGSGLALLACHLPGVEIAQFHLEETLPVETTRAGWLAALGIAEGPDPHVVLLPDPFSCDADALLEGFDRTFPNARRVGGLVSGSFSAGGHRLWCGSSTHHRGAVGVALRGAFVLDTLVAQGCRPIGAPMFVTRHRDNLVLELDGRMALEVLRELLDGLAEPDIRLARRALFVGVALPGNEGHVLGRGDFLVRNLIGVDPTSGGIGVAERLVDNAVIQFHVRDAETSDEDLRAHLAMRDREPARTAGALMFTCMGRGRRLYGEPDHESGILRAAYGELPVAGFFCNGEIGPVGGTTHLHGYTSVIASFVRPPA